MIRRNMERKVRNAILNIGFFHNTAYYLNLHYSEFIKRFIENGHRAVVFSPQDEYVPILLSKGAFHVNVDLTRRGQNVFQESVLFLSLVKMFRKQKLDVLFNYSIKPVIYGSLAARLSGVENVFSTITGRGYVFGNATLSQKLLRSFVLVAYRSTLRFNKCVFFQNEDDRSYFVQQKMVTPVNTFVTNGTGIDLTAYQPGTNGPDPNTFLMITRLLKDKGVYEYIAAATKIKSRYPYARFLLAGPIDDNPMAIGASELESWVKHGIIEYLGVLPDVRETLQRASVFVLPSYYREGLPRVNLEAMAMGKPVITTDWPGCRETVIDGKNGFLVAAMNADELTAAMARFLEQPELVTSMGRASRQIAEERYDVHKVNNTIIEQIQTKLQKALV